MQLSQQDRIIVDSIKGAFLPTVKNIPIKSELVAIALKELADELRTGVITLNSK